MKPDISIIIPLYNKERYIRRTIDSVLHQTFQNFECIIVDSSTDESVNLVNQYNDPRIILVACEKSTAAQARNHGVMIAQSDLVAFLDADDEWQPDHLETLHRIRKLFPDAGVYSTPYVKLKPDGRPMVMIFYDIPRPPWEGYLQTYLTCCSRGDEPVHASSCAVPRDIFQMLGGFPEDLVYGEDQFLWGKIALIHPVAFSWKGLTIYHTDALGRICDEAHAIQEHPFSAYLRQELAAGTIPPEKIRECRAYIKRKWLSVSFSRLLTGSGTESSKDATSPAECSSSGTAGIKNKLSSPMKIVGRFLIDFYHSSIHDAFRRCLCKIYGCYDPGPTLNSGKKTKFLGR